MQIDPEAARAVGGELEQVTTALVQRLRPDLVIVTTGDLEQAVIDRQQIGDAIAHVEFVFADLVKAAYKTHRLLCDRRRDLLAPLLRIDDVLASAISNFKTRADREREARERQLAEEQREQDQARAAAEAAHLESSGQPELAASVISEAIAAPLPTVVVEDPLRQVDGLKFRRYWRWRFASGPTDVTRTPGPVIARAMQLVPREFLMVDARKVSAYASAMKSAGKIPGLDIYFVDEPVR
jgi:hypothetical protein